MSLVIYSIIEGVLLAFVIVGAFVAGGVLGYRRWGRDQTELIATQDQTIKSREELCETYRKAIKTRDEAIESLNGINDRLQSAANAFLNQRVLMPEDVGVASVDAAVTAAQARDVKAGAT